MSDLTSIEKRKLERALNMSGGYVLDFSNRTFSEFFVDCCSIDIYDSKYEQASGSKANRMRAFWSKESNYLVGKVLGLLFDEWQEFKGFDDVAEPPEECRKILHRLRESAPVADLSAISPNAEEQSFETLARSVQNTIKNNEPEVGLDRLHTFLIKYFRVLCTKRGLDVGREKPLHSLVGEYIKSLRSEGLIESVMTERILKSTISVMEAFNRVRNNQSFAHDNEILNYNESLLIFNHVASSIRFIEALESSRKSKADLDDSTDVPF